MTPDETRSQPASDAPTGRIPGPPAQPPTEVIPRVGGGASARRAGSSGQEPHSRRELHREDGPSKRTMIVFIVLAAIGVIAALIGGIRAVLAPEAPVTAATSTSSTPTATPTAPLPATTTPENIPTVSSPAVPPVTSPTTPSAPETSQSPATPVDTPDATATQDTPPQTQTPQPDPTPEPTPTPRRKRAPLPPGASKCGPSTGRGPATTCGFAVAVRTAYLAAGGADRQARAVEAYSPARRRTYVMTCVPGADSRLIVCTGGADAVVYIR